MKELSIEEKAKRYDEAIKRIENIKTGKCETTFMFTEGLFEHIFPELAESEDKKMVKFIKKQLFDVKKTITENYELDAKLTKAIDWLEKQGEQNLANSAKTCKDEQNPNPCDGCVNRKGCINCENGELREVEQKPADEVEPKIKAGDWVVCNNGPHHIFQVIERSWPNAKYRNINGTEILLNVNTLDKQYHLWTIQDAKDGDVLSFNDGHGNDCIELIKSITGKKIEFWFCLTNGNYYEVFDGIIPYTNLVSREDATPATKEQRDTLMKAIADAGYEWDAEKKELRKVEQKPIDKIQPKFKIGWTIKKEGFNLGFTIIKIEDGFYYNDMGDHFPFTDQDKWELVEQKSAWNEEDEKCINELIKFFDSLTNCLATEERHQENRRWLKFLKSLKDRVQPQNIAYYNPYKEVVESIAEMCKHYDKASRSGLRDFYDNVKVKCKDAKEYESLFPQTTWKPSDEQIEALNYVVNLMASSERPTENDLYYNILKSLREQLKKLREE